MLDQIKYKSENEIELTADELKYILNISDLEEMKSLFEISYKVKEKYIGKKVWFRGIIEFSNICKKDCYYCGIRKSNKNVERFMMKEEEILKGAKWAFDHNYGSVVLQSGERDDKSFIDFITTVIKKIKEISEGKLGITLSLGEQTYETYKTWFDSGAHRYLLRIETTNKNLYSKLHPNDHDFEIRKKCLYLLKDAGFQVGTGVMIGLPEQSIDDLVNDILFFKELDVDMIGMGPYLVSENTPTAQLIRNFDEIKERQYHLGLKMIAAVRLYLHDVNIASTTALQALKTYGREMGLKAGANIIMPNVTDTFYRSSYQLYNDKPCIDENSDLCIDCLESRIINIDEEIGFGEWGDSPHFINKNLKVNDKEEN